MDHPEGSGSGRADRVDFDPRVRLEGTQLSSDGGLLVIREIDDALGLSGLASAAPGGRNAHLSSLRPAVARRRGGRSSKGAGITADSDLRLSDTINAGEPPKNSTGRRLPVAGSVTSIRTPE